jgi:hypothetical protein
MNERTCFLSFFLSRGGALLLLFYTKEEEEEEEEGEAQNSKDTGIGLDYTKQLTLKGSTHSRVAAIMGAHEI